MRRAPPTPQPTPLQELPLTRALRDGPRTVLSIRLDPLAGHYAVCADSLGRVLLLETDHLLLVRMWKGYREAQTAWMVTDNGAGAGAREGEGEEEVASADDHAGRRGVPQGRRGSLPPHLVLSLSAPASSAGGGAGAVPPLSLYLLLYAPRRGLLELWAVPHGKRVGALNVGYGCVLLQPEVASSPTSSAASGVGGGAAPWCGVRGCVEPGRADTPGGY